MIAKSRYLEAKYDYGYFIIFFWITVLKFDTKTYFRKTLDLGTAVPIKKLAVLPR